MKQIVGKEVIHYPEIDSTNDEAKRLIKKGAGEGLVITATAQTQGKGKPGSGWFSPPGPGVYVSAVVKPYRNPSDLADITLLGARAAVKAIKALAGLRAEIKLPNDVMINGKKICGVLVERLASGHVIIGIGVNVNNAAGSFPEALAGSATSLKIQTGKDFDPQLFLNLLLPALNDEYLAYLKEI